MLGRDSCGCLYVTAGDVVVCVRACDLERDDHEFGFSEGWRGNSSFEAGQPRPLEPVEGQEARRVLQAWAGLIADGYAMREVETALRLVSVRRVRREKPHP